MRVAGYGVRVIGLSGCGSCQLPEAVSMLSIHLAAHRAFVFQFRWADAPECACFLPTPGSAALRPGLFRLDTFSVTLSWKFPGLRMLCLWFWLFLLLASHHPIMLSCCGSCQLPEARRKKLVAGGWQLATPGLLNLESNLLKRLAAGDWQKGFVQGWLFMPGTVN